MKKYQILAILLSGMLLSMLCNSYAAAAPRHIEFTSSGFALQLPKRWVRIPQKVFNKKMNELNKVYSGEESAARLKYDYAVQIKSKKWFQYPYMLISVWENKRVEEKDIPEMNKRFKDNILGSNKIIIDTRTVQSNYDPLNYLYTGEFRFNLAQKHPMVLLCAVRYMNEGILKLSAYMPPEMYSKYAPDIREAMQNIRLSPENKYRPDYEEGIKFKEHILPYLKVMIATGILLLLTLLYIWKRWTNNRR